MLVIRLRRIGRAHDPHYRIVVAEHTAPVQGKFVAEVGHYHPKSKEIGLRQEQFLGWIEQGAKPSNTVARLAERAGLAHEHIEVKEYHAKPKKKAQERQGQTAEKAAAPAKAETEENAAPEALETEPKEETSEQPENEVESDANETSDATETAEDSGNNEESTEA